MRTVWQRLLDLLATGDILICADQARPWDKSQWREVLAIGLLREAELADSIYCIDCGEGHFANVYWEIPGVKACFGCPTEGVLDVDIDRLRQWRIDADHIAQSIAGAFGLSLPLAQLLSGRLWHLGRKRLGGRYRDVFFGRGGRSPVTEVSAAIRSSIGQGSALLLTAGRLEGPDGLPPQCQWFDAGSVSRVESGRVVVDLEYLEDRFAADVNEEANIFRREQDVWVIAFQRKAVRLRHIVGFEYLAALLRQPGAELEALSLAGRAESETQAVVASAGLEVADEKTLREVRTALDIRKSELASIPAKDWPARGRLQDEIAKLEGYLSQAEARNGRARKIAGSAQRARTAVTNAIVRAIQNIEKEHKDLGAHLDASIRTGTTLLYLPPEPIDWQF